MRRSIFLLPLKQFLWIWLTLILSLYLSWIVLAKANFLYGFWYDYAGISEHIDHYAPKNRFRHDFETTDAQTRKALFAGIVKAIHHQGHGLQSLTYQDRTKTIDIPLLHSAEIVHLTDVVKLIELLKKLGWGVLFIWGALSIYRLRSRQPFPSPQKGLLNVTFSLFILAIPIAIFGAQKVFYQLHIWVFPADHHWFFYYQDSLMSTMMKAPDLFAYISISLLVLGILLFILIVKLFHALNRIHLSKINS